MDKTITPIKGLSLNIKYDRDTVAYAVADVVYALVVTALSFIEHISQKSAELTVNGLSAAKTVASEKGKATLSHLNIHFSIIKGSLTARANHALIKAKQKVGEWILVPYEWVFKKAQPVIEFLYEGALQNSPQPIRLQMLEHRQLLEAID